MKWCSSEVSSLDRMEQNRQRPTAGWMRSVFIHTTDTHSAWSCWTTLTIEHYSAVNPRNKHKSRPSVHPDQQHALGGILNNEHSTLLFAYKHTDEYYPASAPYEVLKPL
jgi:hypothetical protein